MNILFVSLGCDKNLADTEMMLGLLQKEGYSFTDDIEAADVAVVNTCCFIGDAKEESVNTLLEMAELRKAGRLKALLAAGCLAQRYRGEIRKEIPEVDALVGTMAIEEIVEAVNGVLDRNADRPERDSLSDPGFCAKETSLPYGSVCPESEIWQGSGFYFRDLNSPPPVCRDRVLTTGGHYAYLKIAEGCGKRCTYCVIPQVRGNYRSIPMEALAAQADKLAADGVKELILVAQETTLYGVDLYGRKCLPDLLRRLADIAGFTWIRILYCYPEEITEELIQVMAEEPKICHYLDIPIQHASDGVLRRMGRRTNQEELRQMIGRLRERIPDICLRTTLISGFPGETQEDFEELYRFVNEMEFDRLGVFPYSREEDTPAAEMPDQIDETVKEARRDELMELQQAIAFEKAENAVGQVLKVMVEGKIADEDVYVARTYRDAPGVDGYLFLNTTAHLMTGDFVQAIVTGSNEYDLIGELTGE